MLGTVRSRIASSRNVLDRFKLFKVGDEYIEGVSESVLALRHKLDFLYGEKLICKAAYVVDMHMRDEDRAHSFEINSDFGCRKGAVLTRIEEVVSVGYLKEN
jgi:hypothetical protein